MGRIVDAEVYRVIGLDQSYTGFGYCVGGESLKKVFKPSKISEVHRLDDVRHWIHGWLTEQVGGDNRSVDLIVMEGYANGAKFGREMAGELAGVVKLACLDAWGSPPLIVPPASLKKYVSGSGAAKKNTMLAHTFRRWDVMFSDDNQADAFGLEKFGQGYLRLIQEGDREGLLKYEIEAIEAVRKVS